MEMFDTTITEIHEQENRISVERGKLSDLLESYTKLHCPFEVGCVVTIQEAQHGEYNKFVGRRARILRIKATPRGSKIIWRLSVVMLKKNGDEVDHPVAKYQHLSCLEGDEHDWIWRRE